MVTGHWCDSNTQKKRAVNCSQHILFEKLGLCQRKGWKKGAEKMRLSIVHSIFTLKKWVCVRKRAEKMGLSIVHSIFSLKKWVCVRERVEKKGAEKMRLSIVHSIFSLKEWVVSEKGVWKNGAVNCSQHILFAPRRQLPAGRLPVLTEQPTINIWFFRIDSFLFSSIFQPTVSVSPTAPSVWDLCLPSLLPSHLSFPSFWHPSVNLP